MKKCVLSYFNWASGAQPISESLKDGLFSPQSSVSNGFSSNQSLFYFEFGSIIISTLICWVFAGSEFYRFLQPKGQTHSCIALQPCNNSSQVVPENGNTGSLESTDFFFFPFFGEQKWSKGKVRDKLNNLVLFDKATYDKLCKEVPNYKLITPAVVSERLKIRGSLARAALQELLSKGLIKLVSKQSSSDLHQKHQGWRCPSCWWRCMNRSHQLYILKNKTLLN